MEIIFLGYVAIFIILLGFIEIYRSGNSYIMLYANIFAFRMVIALLMYMFYGYINAGGDSLRYVAISDNITNGTANSFSDILASYNDDSRYIFYIVICAALYFFFGTAGVILFQSCLHILSGFFIHLTLRKLNVDLKRANFILFIYIFYPYLIFYSAVYLRDIYLALATAWFVYGLVSNTTYFGKIVNLLVPLLIITGIRVQYIPFYLIFYIAYYFYDKKVGIKWYQWLFIGLGLTLLLNSQWADFLSTDKLINYLVASGDIADDPNLAYRDYNALDYLSIKKMIITFIGLFGPYHMFRGGNYIFLEYRGDYIERLSEGLSALLNIAMLLSILWFAVSQYILRDHKYLGQDGCEVKKSQLRKAILVFLLALIVLLSFVGYNRWKMPLVPILFIYFGICNIKASNFLSMLMLVLSILSLSVAFSFLFGT